MKIIWLGHASFRIEIEAQILLVDPWLEGNPSFPDDRRAEAIAGATHILLTHAHGDHASEVVAISKETKAPIVGIYDLVTFWQGTEGIEGVGFNKGGAVMLGGVRITMVNAVHSSTMMAGEIAAPVGSEAGFIVKGEGRTIYISGDTDVMADMEIIADRYEPDIGILCAGGYFTMDMEGAAFAATRFFDFKVVIPCHYKTFPLLAQNADALVSALSEVDVKTPDVMETLNL